MLKKIEKIPAGTFLLPMILSMLLISFFPNMYSKIGSITEDTFSKSLNAMVGILVFSAGTTLDLKQVGPLLKRHVPLMLFKLVISTLYIIGFYYLFGSDGILGINLLAFATVIYSLNPAVALAIHSDYGDKDFPVVYGIYGIFCMSFTPLLLLSFFGISGASGGFNWTPVISIFIPLILGVILGNIDSDFSKLFSPLISGILPFLGWNLGVGMNLGDAIKSGIPGIVMAIIFAIFMLPLVFFDKKISPKDNGIYGAAIWNVAGMSVANPAIIATALGGVYLEQTTSATAIVMMVCIITSILSPILAKKLYDKK